MKSRILIIGIFLITCFISCEKADPYIVTDQYGPKYCISYIKDGLKTILLSAEELNMAKSLFETNHLDYSQLQFYRLQLDDQGNHHVRCNQYVNGLEVFTNEVIFHFKPTGSYYFLSGELTDQINLDTLFIMPEDSVIEMFLHKVDQDSWNHGKAEEFKQGCFDLEPGYYDLDRTWGLGHRNYTKAWKVNAKNKKYPYAYINDQTSEVIYYDNGVRE